MKLITLEALSRYNDKLQNLIVTLRDDIDRVGAAPIDPELIQKDTITKEMLDQALKDAIDKALSALQNNDIAGDRAQIEQNKTDADNKIDEINQKIEDIESLIDGNKTDTTTEIGKLIADINEVTEIINGNKDAIEAAQGQIGTTQQALANAVENVANTNQALSDLSDKVTSDVSALNSSISTLGTALDDVQGEVTAIKTNMGALDSLDDMKTEIEGINDIVDALQKQDLTTYVKKENLSDGVVTTMVTYDIIDEDTKEVNFYKKEEFPDKVIEQLGDYVTSDELESYEYYNEEKTAAKVKEMMLSGDGENLKQGLLEKTAEYVQSQYTEYVNGELENYSTREQTAQAISDVVGNIDVDTDGTIKAQISSVTQRAGAIETAISSINDNLVENYMNNTQTAEYVSTHMENYVAGELANYSTTEQTNAKIAHEIAAITGTDLSDYYTREETATYVTESVGSLVDGKLENYSTKTQTAEEIRTEIAKIPSPDLTNYYNKSETAEKISTVLYEKNLTDEDGATNVYTKDETAAQVKTQLINKGLLNSEGETNVYTKTETAEKITSDVQAYTNDALAAYSTTEQTADNLKAHLKSIGVTGENDVLLVATSSSVESTVKAKADELNGSISDVAQTASSISSTVTSISNTVGEQSSVIQQLNNAIGLTVKSTDIEGKNLISKINMSDGTVGIDGKLIHITGDTLFDDDVTIKGNMTAGTISCDSGVSINAGGVSINNNGLTVTNSNNGSMKFDSNGMTFVDGKGTYFEQFGRFASGDCKDGDTVHLNWDRAPVFVMISPRKIKTSVAGNTANDMFLECYADNVSSAGFKCVCRLTVYGTKNGDTQTFSLGTSTINRSNASTNYNNVSQTFTTADMTLPSSSVTTTINGTINFSSEGTNPTGNFASATSGSMTVLPGTNLTVTATPATGYSIPANGISVTAASGGLSSNNTYTVTLGSHDNSSVTMVADRTGYTQYGLKSAYVDVYVDGTKYGTITAPVSGTQATATATFSNYTIKHSGGSKIKLVMSGTWNYLATKYKVDVSGVRVVPQVSDLSVGTTIDTGSDARYIAFG